MKDGVIPLGIFDSLLASAALPDTGLTFRGGLRIIGLILFIPPLGVCTAQWVRCSRDEVRVSPGP